jgi:hypothetical protein
MTFDRRPPLRICNACARHVFATETTCPFCAALLAPVSVRPRFKLSSRLSRAQRFALAGAFAGLIACDAAGPNPEYGGAPPPPPSTGGTNGATGTGGGAAVYDSGMAVTGKDGGDSGADDSGADDAGDDAGDDDGGQHKD